MMMIQRVSRRDINIKRCYLFSGTRNSQGFMENVDMEMYSRTVSQTNTVELSGKVVFLETLEVLYS